jgi:hypothetical protein
MGTGTVSNNIATEISPDGTQCGFWNSGACKACDTHEEYVRFLTHARDRLQCLWIAEFSTKGLGNGAISAMLAWIAN